MIFQEHTEATSRALSILGRQCMVSAIPHRIRLPKGALLRPLTNEPRFAHVLESGIVSTSILLADGRTVSVRMHGAGDILEIDQLLGCCVRNVTNTVLVPGIALRVPFDCVQNALEYDRDLQRKVLQTLGTRAMELEQMTVCNRIHSLEQRLARHLLQLADLAPCMGLPITQEELAQHLGVRRSSIVGAAGVLRQKGLIGFRRGNIAIIHAEQLEREACECYKSLRTLQQHAQGFADGITPQRHVA